ncbi:MAG TPA: gfo/Idh/MocA family oxidoreductase, partial [Candidatus Omnitrophota bacterium]|nr:gfo/Idh/MocA family oxidoreductase [Candidatus Omnitrophota bacterium]
IATWQHWAQNISQGIKHLLGTLRYGNEIVFGRFAEAVLNDTPMEGVGAEDALRILKMQHEVINNAKYLYK